LGNEVAELLFAEPLLAALELEDVPDIVQPKSPGLQDFTEISGGIG
jgi:hypothetical protein